MPNANGQYLMIDGAPALRFERNLSQTPQKVWSALVEPADLAKWMQADATVDAEQGGRFELRFHAFDHSMLGRIITWDPPKTLEYTWPEADPNGNSIVRFELSPTLAGCRLILTHILRAGGDMADFASGWHWHLDALDAALLGEARLFDRPAWAALREIYAAAL